MASGVRTGNTRSMNQASSQMRSSGPSSAVSPTTMPAAPSRPRNSPQTRRWSASRVSARARISASCWAGVRPSGLGAVTPALAWPISPAMRTETNSSRLAALIETKRSRSSSGWRGFSASSTTRWLKSSQESSRLRKRSGLSGAMPGAGGAASARRLAAGASSSGAEGGVMGGAYRSSRRAREGAWLL